ncbi:MAG: hypothetical protein NTY69_02395 [Methylococcales bacterium]|nr:hypothetical protein [Methylococcales bacterium]
MIKLKHIAVIAFLSSSIVVSNMAEAAGAVGAQGPTGPAGPRGPDGPRGPEGPKGDKGLQGPQGNQGKEGPIGKRGATGSKGDKGDKGDRGTTGPVGDKGATGPRGDKGPAGASQGLQGIQGPKGDTGLQGEQGNAGPKGDKGDQGVQGIQGAKGDTGSFNYSMTCGVSGKEACKVGAVGPGGGWIFFVDKDDQYPGFDYLEAAPTDIEPTQWCDINDSIPAVNGFAARAIGMGKVNTIAILGVCNSGAANSAHTYSTPTTIAGDWYLPSDRELHLLYENLVDVGVGGFSQSTLDCFNNPTYNRWSSTEYDSGSVIWIQDFDQGAESLSNKYFEIQNTVGETTYTEILQELFPVRPIRSF